MVDAHYLTLSDEAARRAEFFVEHPAGEGPWPAVVFVHGHQYPDRPGGRRIADSGYLSQLAEAGALGIAISQPGYGGSDGPPDYCGPHTQAVILAVLQHAIDHLHAGRIALIGASRGAIASAMVATQTDLLDALIVSAGIYDFAAGYRDCPWSGIKRNIELEAGTTRRAFRERSVLPRAKRIKCPVLVMHGGQADQISPEHAKRFAATLAERQVPVEMKIYPEEPHAIARARLLEDGHRFINRWLGTALPVTKMGPN